MALIATNLQTELLINALDTDGVGVTPPANAMGVVGNTGNAPLEVVRNGQTITLNKGEYLLQGDQVKTAAGQPQDIFLSSKNPGALTKVSMAPNSEFALSGGELVTSTAMEISEVAAGEALGSTTEIAEAEAVSETVVAAAEAEATEGLFGAALMGSAAVPVFVGAGSAGVALLAQGSGETGTDTSTGADASEGTGTGGASGNGTGTGTATGTGGNTGSGTGTGSSTGTDTSTDTGTGTETNTGTNTNPGTNTGTNTGSNTGTGEGTSTGASTTSALSGQDAIVGFGDATVGIGGISAGDIDATNMSATLVDPSVEVSTEPDRSAVGIDNFVIGELSTSPDISGGITNDGGKINISAGSLATFSGVEANPQLADVANVLVLGAELVS